MSHSARTQFWPVSIIGQTARHVTMPSEAARHRSSNDLVNRYLMPFFASSRRQHIRRQQPRTSKIILMPNIFFNQAR